MDIRKIGALFVFSFSLCLISCKKECEQCSPQGITENYIRYEGKTYELRSGRLEYYGIWDDNPAPNIDLILYTDQGTEYYEIYFQLFTQSNQLESGRYQFNGETRRPDTYNNSYFYMIRHNFNTDRDETVYPAIALNDGTVEVLRNGNEYKIGIDCSNGNGQPFTASFKGKLPYYNMRTDF